MTNVGKRFSRGVVFGASGGIGKALCEGLAQRGTRVVAASRSGSVEGYENLSFDLDDEASIAATADALRDDPPDCIIVATGVLTLANGIGPERSYKQVEAEAMARVLYLNTVGPALIAKHVLPLLPRDRLCAFAALSARVGSIGDNGLGGWHSYRASKAALNMLIRNWSIELGRTHKQAVVCGLHPGTVDTALSEPFQKNVPDKQLFTPERSAAALIDVLSQLDPQDSGGVYDWKGERIPA